MDVGREVISIRCHKTKREVIGPYVHPHQRSDNVGESTKLPSLCSVGAGGWKERLLAVHRSCLFYGLETSTMSCADCDHSS